jgi:hypothetical protein
MTAQKARKRKVPPRESAEQHVLRLMEQWPESPATSLIRQFWHEYRLWPEIIKKLHRAMAKAAPRNRFEFHQETVKAIAKAVRAPMPAKVNPSLLSGREREHDRILLKKLFDEDPSREAPELHKLYIDQKKSEKQPSLKWVRDRRRDFRRQS